MTNWTFKQVLAAVDFSEPSLRAADLAAEMAKRYEASLVLVHCCEPPMYGYPDMAMGGFDMLSVIETEGRQQLDAELARVRAAWPRTTAILKTGRAWEQLLSTADAVSADLIVVGTHGRKGVSHLLLGSVAEKVVRGARTPVLTVPAGRPQER